MSFAVVIICHVCGIMIAKFTHPLPSTLFPISGNMTIEIEPISEELKLFRQPVDAPLQPVRFPPTITLNLEKLRNPDITKEETIELVKEAIEQYDKQFDYMKYSFMSLHRRYLSILRRQQDYELQPLEVPQTDMEHFTVFLDLLSTCLGIVMSPYMTLVVVEYIYN